MTYVCAEFAAWFMRANFLSHSFRLSLPQSNWDRSCLLASFSGAPFKDAWFGQEFPQAGLDADGSFQGFHEKFPLGFGKDELRGVCKHFFGLGGRAIQDKGRGTYSQAVGGSADPSLLIRGSPEV